MKFSDLSSRSGVTTKAYILTSSPQSLGITASLHAAQYVRMSTERQHYSPENQADAIATYASLHGMQIVKTYEDLGRSGLDLAGREGLRTLLNDVAQGGHGFSVLLVYDVSRWGRFQDADESAYYEYTLKKAGIQVHYCAEQFINDTSLPSVLFKAIKRTMAGEYSRELSRKVFVGKSRIVELGFRGGGTAGFGFRRQLVDKDRNPKGLLGAREHKSVQSDRVILIPGPEEELVVIGRIYQSFVGLGKGESAIAAELNAGGVKRECGRPWTREVVHQILSNPKYVGENVTNRRSCKLKQREVRNPPDMWVRCEHAFEPIISQEEFKNAQAIIHDRRRNWTDDEMLDGLLVLLKKVGTLSARLIDDAESLPSSGTYILRFGGLARAYALIGWQGSRDLGFVETRRALRGPRKGFIEGILDGIIKSGASLRRCDGRGLLLINGEFTASVRIARCVPKPRGHQWRVGFERSRIPDISLIARLSAGNQSILDYFAFPAIGLSVKQLNLGESNALDLNVYRSDNLESFLSLCRRKRIEGVG
jgi:DNA invertase Pin-like site-specific DNA recombinase